MIKLQGTDKLQYYFEISSWWVMETILKFPLLVSILKFRKTYRLILKCRYMIPSLVPWHIGINVVDLEVPGSKKKTQQIDAWFANVFLYYPTALNYCRDIVFAHGVRAGGQLEKVCAGFIS